MRGFGKGNALIRGELDVLGDQPNIAKERERERERERTDPVDRSELAYNIIHNTISLRCAAERKAILLRS